MPLSLDERQFAFWQLRRSGLVNIQIADRFKISRQAVSKALLAMNRKVEETLIEMAQANQIEVERMNAEIGVLFGRSVPFDAAAIVFVSADHGVQVWYEHEGDCGTCPRYARCIELLWGYADELGITLEKTDDPTRLADELFAKLREMI
jgi:transcriptional regulator